MKNPAYAFLRVRPLRREDIPDMISHCERSVRVPHANPNVPNLTWTPWTNPSPRIVLETINERIMAPRQIAPGVVVPGATTPGKGHHIAFEALLAVTPDHDRMPSPELFAERVLAFSFEVWGQHSIVAMWLHLDEGRSAENHGPEPTGAYHAHVLAIPFVEGPGPGRPRKCQDENGNPRAAIASLKRVSWNKFSGADMVNFRDPKKAKTKAQLKRASLPQNKQNKTLQGWQTRWAEYLRDFGFARGVPSKRRHLSQPYIRFRTSQISEEMEAARMEIMNPGAWLKAGELRRLAFVKDPETAMMQYVAEAVRSLVDTYLSRAQELAARGIQLESEKKARSDLNEAHEQLKDVSTKQSQSLALALKLTEETSAANRMLRDRIAVLEPLAQPDDLDAILNRCVDLSDEDFQAIMDARADMKRASRRTASLKLPSPTQSNSPVPDVGSIH